MGLCDTSMCVCAPQVQASDRAAALDAMESERGRAAGEEVCVCVCKSDKERERACGLGGGWWGREEFKLDCLGRGLSEAVSLLLFLVCFHVA